MFNFTTTTFIHSRDQFEANPNNTVNTFWVNGVNLFKKEDIVGIYRNPYTDPVNGKLEVVPGTVYTGYTTVASADNLPAISNRTHFRLNFYLRRSGDNNSYYSNDMVFKGKDFHYEWTGNKTAAQLAKIFTKINKLYGDIYLKIYASGNNLVFENDNYGLFTEATVEFWEDANSDCCTYREGQWRVLDELDLTAEVHFEDGADNCSYLDPSSTNAIAPLTDAQQNPYINSSESELEAAGSLIIHKCVNGFGTYQQLMKDLRLPTAENDGPWSITAQQQELPIPGNKYVQYTLHYISCRGVLGGSAVGEVTHSKTTHVFFVPADCCACASGMDADFLTALETAGLGQLLVDVQAGVVGDGKGIAEKHDPTVNPITATQPVADEESFAITNYPVANPPENSENDDPVIGG